MKKSTARALMIVVGVFVLLVILGLGSAAWPFTNAIDVGEASEADASREFDRIRERFAGVQPVIVVDDDDPRVTRRPSDAAPAVRLSTMRVLVWDPDEQRLTRIDIPFWFLRLKSGPIEIGTNEGVFGGEDLGLTVEELERLGPTLVLDHEDEGGDRIILWTE